VPDAENFFVARALFEQRAETAKTASLFWLMTPNDNA
jgi:hypothetical protein